MSGLDEERGAAETASDVGIALIKRPDIVAVRALLALQ
jgi:hypothetical protein